MSTKTVRKTTKKPAAKKAATKSVVSKTSRFKSSKPAAKKTVYWKDLTNKQQAALKRNQEEFMKTLTPAQKAKFKKWVQQQKKKKSARLTWNDLTPAQQARLKREHKAALAKARKDIAGGGRTYERTTVDGYDVYASNEKLVLHITPDCVKDACRSSKKDCVIARAIKKQQQFADGWQVGHRISTIHSDKAKEVVRYGTSSKLSRALAEFDRTGLWNLAYGHYTLNPLPAGYRVGTRWAWYKASGGKASKFKGAEKVTRSGTYRSEIKKAV
jgi:hypothetical protein